MILATLNEPIPLHLLAADGRTDLYGQARIYDSLGALVNTTNLTHLTEGLYGATWTPTAEGYYSFLAELYFDVGRTVSAGYEKQGETIDVSEFRTNVLRLLGLVHENAVVDQQVYNIDGNITSARIRVYDSKANATLAGLVGVRFSYTVQAAYSGSDLTSYKILRDV